MTTEDYWLELIQKIEDVNYLSSHPQQYWESLLPIGEAMKHKNLCNQHIHKYVSKYAPDKPIFGEEIINRNGIDVSKELNEKEMKKYGIKRIDAYKMDHDAITRFMENSSY